MEFKNIEENDIKLPITLTLAAREAQNIIGQLNSNDIECIAKADEKTLTLTFGVKDIEKVNKLLQPYNINEPLDNLVVTAPKAEKKEDLIPFANSISNLYERKLNGTVSKMSKHHNHIKTLQTAVKDSKDAAERLTSRNNMLKGIEKFFPFFQNPVNALIKSNENKIDRLISRNIPKLEKQIRIHQTTIEKLSIKAEKHTTRKNLCRHLSDVVKNFGIADRKERSIQYLTAMSALNGDMQKINAEKLNNCIDSIAKFNEKYPQLSPQQQSRAKHEYQSLEQQKKMLEVKGKKLQAAQLDYAGMIGRVHQPEISEAVDKAESVFDTHISEGNFTFGNAVDFLCIDTASAICETASQVQADMMLLDKDGDLIPDRLDSTFNPEVTRHMEETDNKAVKEKPAEPQTPGSDEEYMRARVTDDEYKNLKENGFKCAKKRSQKEEAIPVIRFKKSDEVKFNKIMEDFSHKKFTKGAKK